jgi:hypothetical protein
MKAEKATKENGYELVPITLSKEGLKTFGNYEELYHHGRNAYLVKHIGVRPRRGRKMQDDFIQVLFEGRKETQTWHKDFFAIPERNPIKHEKENI